ncbi:ATP-binding cassette domain-containing protein [Niveispirillum sp. SYP-B3756]|uniref:ATP-binding cassette domain-containing protein n=1 Tax=Niveispirillum sp. SYP-B3756 TaxID=2662178 RepID=UPI0012928260|nr:ATP-binding cassette domain-containing protein [Niveispirillum sp. SYP-B3756]MQP66438.1 ATP-binding cassette domain-containing protein [Niveispirillum sp. SYP-B3756]
MMAEGMDASSSARPFAARVLSALAGAPKAAAGQDRFQSLRDALDRTRTVTLQQLAQAAILAACCGTAVLAVINKAAALASDDGYSLVYVFLFFILIIGYNLAQKFFTKGAARDLEMALHDIRGVTATRIARLDLRHFESFSNERFYSALVRYYEMISMGIVNLLSGVQSGILFLFSICYVFYLSPAAFLLTLVAVGFLTYGYLMKAGETDGARQEAAVAETRLMDGVHDLIQGFKELKLDPAKRAIVVDEIKACSAQAAERRSHANDVLTDLIVYINSTFYLLSGAVVFLLPLFSQGSHEQIERLVMVVLFAASSLMSGVGATVQTVAGVRLAAQGIRAFEGELDGQVETHDDDVGTTTPPPFRSLALRDVHYTHATGNGDQRFSIGPINFDARPGEIVFITGGNGSGKSTALKVMTALYPAMGGQLLLNGAPLGVGATESNRRLFGTVFAEFYTFHRLFNITAEREPEMWRLLTQMQLAEKLPGGLMNGFNPAALSTGQRKRLALVIALLEDRPILLFDEWAADQDPEFRAIFYREILPGLKAAGKAVIAVTHDDRYFDVADRRYHMDEGKMRELTAA